MLGYCARRVRRIWYRLTVKPAPTPKAAELAIKCREINPADLDAVIDLLTRGFWRQPRSYWVQVLNQLTLHDTPEGFPKYGNLLENNGKIIGVLLLIFANRTINGVSSVWCSGSSYYVEPQFRTYAFLLLRRSHRYKGVTYLDLTASPHRWPAMQAEGYQRIAEGIYMCLPALCKSPSGVQVRKARVDEPVEEQALLATHARYPRCISLVCEHRGALHPFVFGVRQRRGVPFAYLIYSRDQAEFVQFAGAIGRFFLKRGIGLVALDTDGPILHMPGWFTTFTPRWWNGGCRPRLGDLAYTEIPMFGGI